MKRRAKSDAFQGTAIRRIGGDYRGMAKSSQNWLAADRAKVAAGLDAESDAASAMAKLVITWGA